MQRQVVANDPGRVVAALIGAALIAFVLVSLPQAGDLPRLFENSPGVTVEQVSERRADSPLTFVKNEGQLDESVRYYFQGADASIYFTDRGVRMSLSATAMSDPEPGAEGRWVLEHRFLGAGSVQPAATRHNKMTVSYFKGDRSNWHTGLSTFERIVYRDVWPKIDLVYSGTAEGLVYDAIVHPGADPTDIGLTWQGATDVAETSSGDLLVETGVGAFIDEAPVAFQRVRGERQVVGSQFDLHGTHYGFNLDRYDVRHKLVIDPVVLVYAGYIGGSGADGGAGIAVDSSGAAYVTGNTPSSAATFPETVGPDLTHNSDNDAFVAKVAPDGTSLVYAGYIGGSGIDFGFDIAIDSTGAAYITGLTLSDQTTFPVTGGPDATYNTNQDAFVAKVAPDGTSLVYAGYIGGNDSDGGTDIAVDSSGAAYVTGDTNSTAATFPVNGGPDLVHNGASDVFVAKVATGGGSLVYAGYIGGSSLDSGSGIAIDSSGAAYITGLTRSDQATFPVTIGPDTTLNDSNVADAFVAKVAGGGSLVYAGYIGGSGPDQGNGIAVDASGAAYVAGSTQSLDGSFPVTVGPDTSVNGGLNEAFVAKVASNGGGLVYSGFIGGNSDDFGRGIAVDSTGAAYVVGDAQSSETTFPDGDGLGGIGALDVTYNGAQDVFVAQVAPGGASLVFAGYIGGISSDFGSALALDPVAAAIYIAGTTSSPATSFPAMVGPDLSHNADQDAFVAKIVETFTLTVSTTGTGAGNVTSSPAGISCAADCTEDFVTNTSVTLTPSASSGSFFAGWSGACTGSGACTVSMTQARNVTATFQQIPTTLTVQKAGTGSGTVASSPPGIECGTECAEVYATGTQITLTATPDEGSELASWDDCDSVTGNECRVSMSKESRIVTATFDEIPAPDVERHARSLSLRLRRHLVAKGRVTVSDDFAACASGVRVRIQRRRAGNWRTVKRVTTAEDGSYRTKLRHRQGRYRATIRKLALSETDICRKATSRVRRHRH